MDAEPGQEPGAELDRLAREVIGAGIEVHRTLGPGFLESAYEEALTIELTDRGISVARQTPLVLRYKGREIGQNRLDLLVEQQLIVELKAVDQLTALHTAQVMSYLKAAGLNLGLLLNFNVPVLRDGIKRVVLKHA